MGAKVVKKYTIAILYRHENMLLFSFFNSRKSLKAIFGNAW